MKRLIVALCSIISTACFAASPLIVLTPENHTTIVGEIESASTGAFLNSFLGLDSNRRVVFISSPGGSVMDGMKLIQVVRDEKIANKNLRVLCYVDEAASMAFAIVQAVCDERLGGSTSVLMQHQATYGIQGQDNQVISRLKMLSSILKVLDAVQAKRIGITVEELRRRSADEWWTVGQEAVASRTLDALAPITCSKALLEGTKEIKFSGFFGAGVATFSKCPLIRGPVNITMNDKSAPSDSLKKSFERPLLSPRR